MKTGIIRTTQSQVVQIGLWFAQHKDKIQERLNSGATNISELARQKGTSVKTIRNILEGLGLEIPKRNIADRVSKTRLLNNMMIVMERICVQLNIPCDEIKQYLVGNGDNE